ncbi:hypothetical protein [Pseudomonas chlororaphis]|uniref:TRAFAC clade GTPase domain-containing protein n=1 Tax=Pseudomonas chlororaphis TaxID=587753 RepID=UPI002365F071|nr:hypothetical protein [Pseudomonas chlororaphis]WDH19918.1 hypothetical protein PUP50_17895 [Pseudomonas chlororaphis]
MALRSIVLIGGPDSGKTNYLARLWPSFQRKKGALRADRIPEDISYVDGAVEHLMKGEFAPRSDRNLEVGRADFSIDVRAGHGTGDLRTLMVPDISGELWTKTVSTSEIPADWLSVLQEAEGAILFVRHGSDQTVQPMDWVVARSVLNLFAGEETVTDTADSSHTQPDAVGSSQEQSEAEATEESEESEHCHEDLPTQVLLCELLRYLNLLLADRADGSAPKVSIVVAAWDLVDPELKAEGPLKYLEREYPLFAGRLSCEGRLDIKVFGVSIVGGDLNDDPTFRAQYLEKHISEQGYVSVQESDSVQTVEDVTLPIAWAAGE